MAIAKKQKQSTIEACHENVNFVSDPQRFYISDANLLATTADAIIAIHCIIVFVKKVKLHI